MLELPPNTIIAGEFRVERALAHGGMGGVYVARQLSTGQERALKIMHPSLVQDPRLRERFEQEARVGSRIVSEHVVQTIGAGVDTTLGIPWIAMELLRGEDLASYATSRGPMPIDAVLGIFRPLCHALGAAHAAGIVHRDIKPENVFVATAHSVDRQFDVKVLDFGIAKLVADARDMPTAHVGTPLWMAPEQTDPGAAVTPATDVWALGLVAFRLLTGRCYWRVANHEGSSLEALMRESLVEPLVPASVRAAELGVPLALPQGFDSWFANTVNRDPTRRYPSAKEALEALEQLSGARPTPYGSSAVVTSLPPAQAASSPPPRKSSVGKVLAVGGIGLVLLMLVVGGVALAGLGYVFREELASLVSPDDVAPSPTLEPSAAAEPVAASTSPPPASAHGEPTSTKPTATGARSQPSKSPGPSTPSSSAAQTPSVEASPPAEASNEPPPFNRAVAESKVKAAAASAASQCKAQKKPDAEVETFTGSRGFGPGGNTTLSFNGPGGARQCAMTIMRSVTYGKYGGKPEFHVEVVPFTVTVQ